ncbi:MAG: outer membrane protein assembly factor [Acidaminococcaceae bacterium]
MNKKMILRPLALGVTAVMLTALPVFAEEKQQEMTQPEQKVAEPAPIAEATTNKPVVTAEQKTAPYVGTVVTKISVTGNNVVSYDEFVKVLTLQPGQVLTKEAIAKEMQAIYETGWYYDVNVDYNPVPEGVEITYRVLENPIFKELKVEGNTKLSTGKIKNLMDMPTDKIVNTKDLNERVRKVEAEYNKAGYILARVGDVRMLPSGELVLEINEGVVEAFKIKGNVKTKDYVITREMKLKKGEPFNAQAARRSMQRIYNLGYFEDVNIKLNPGQAPNAVDIEISVVEMNTGTFGIGAGYSDADGFLGMLSLGDKNFRGTGDKVNVRWEFGGSGHNNRNYEFSYMRPWLDKKETSLGFTLYDLTNEYVDYNRDGDEIARYDKQRKGQEVTFSRRTNNEYIVNYVTLKNRDDSYKGAVDHGRQYFEEGNKEERLKENFGVTRSIGFTRVMDTRDNIYDPHEGKRTSYSIEWAGIGGDFNFTKYSVDYRYYYRVGAENVLALQLGAGGSTGTMPLSQRFAVGGSETLRGFEDDQFKGSSMLRASLEYRMPLMKKVQGVVFTDAGYAWSERYNENNFELGLIKYSYGIGLRVNSPLGPLRLDYGIPVSGGKGGRFHFSFGGQF